MEKINFENGVTKGNATTFNQMQDNIEEAIGGVYAKAEKFTGKYWINGKKIYSKVLYVSSIDCTAAGYKTINHGISNLEMVTDIKYIIDTPTKLITYNSAISCLEALINGDGSKTYLQFYTGAWDVIKNWNFIIEYTKTTD